MAGEACSENNVICVPFSFSISVVDFPADDLASQSEHVAVDVGIREMVPQYMPAEWVNLAHYWRLPAHLPGGDLETADARKCTDMDHPSLFSLTISIVEASRVARSRMPDRMYVGNLSENLSAARIHFRKRSFSFSMRIANRHSGSGS